MSISTVLVVGAGGVLGRDIARRLRASGRNVLAAYRTPRPGLEDALRGMGARPLRLDLAREDEARAALGEADAAVFTPILTVSAWAAPLLRNDQRAVFFSSNNAAVDHRATVYARLRDAEIKTLSAAPQATILRPTMIFGYPGDGNIATLMAAMQRWPVVPLPGRGDALQQPIDVSDLAAIALGALDDAGAAGRVRAAGGPRALSQRDLFRAVAEAAGVRLRTLGLPLGPGASVLAAAERIGLRLPVSSAQLRRAGADKIPHGADPILGKTPLDQSLKALAAALDGA